MCKFQLELVSSGGLCLLDFLLGGDPLVYFMEVVITTPIYCVYRVHSSQVLLVLT